MILGLDLYGTLTAHAPKLRELAYSVLDTGGEVHIISAVKPENEARALTDCARYLPEATPHVLTYNNYGMVPKLKWEMCVALGVQMYIDDRKDTVNYLSRRKILALLVSKTTAGV